MSLTFQIAPESLEELKELLGKSLLRGRAFVTDVDFLPSAEQAASRERCTLLVVEATQGSRATLEAEIVFVQTEGPGRGVGLELREKELNSALQALVEACKKTSAGARNNDRRAFADGGTEGDDAGKGKGHKEEFKESPAGIKKKSIRNVHDRVRALSSAERDRMARTGALTERVALERAYGSSVWEALLQNPQLSGGELSRIAKNGTAPTPILAIIANNAGWISRGEVRRGLLSNPRLGAALIERVLRACPKNELKLVASQAMYPARVRSVATKLAKPQG